MTERAIRGDIPFLEWNISPYCPTRGISIIDLSYDFRVTIGTGNNEQAIQGNVALEWTNTGSQTITDIMFHIIHC